MADIRTLTALMRELDDQLATCMRCGMCQAVCPLYGETGSEADVARGKLALLDGLVDEMFADPRGVAERLNRCLLCGSCAANCPSGVNVLDIFIKARAILAEYMGLSPLKRAVLRGVLAHPGRFDRILEMGARVQRFFTKPASDIVGTSCARIGADLLAGRHFRTLAKVPFHRETPSVSTRGRRDIRAAFFVGCLIDKIFPRVAKSALKALDYHGTGVFLPENQACCGIPMISAGDVTAFRKTVRHNLQRFSEEDFDVLLTACATCTATIKKIWPLMFEMEADLDAVRRLSEKTQDIHAFFIDTIGVSRLSQKDISHQTPVTYHAACHLKKSLGVVDQPLSLIAANPAYQLVEMAEPDWCCGLGGSFNLQYYELSARIGERKRRHIVETNAQIVATGCPACMIQISDLLSRAGDPIAVKHPVELYGEGLSS
jgi:glycolate oxidase iron-sulfur subunit